MVMDFMLEMLLSAGLLVTTIFLFVIVFLAYLRMRNTKMLLISSGFGAFFLGAVLNLTKIVFEEYSSIIDENVLLLLQFVGLLFIAIGVLKD